MTAAAAANVGIPQSIARAFPNLQGLQSSVAADVSETLHDPGRCKAPEQLTLVHLKGDTRGVGNSTTGCVLAEAGTAVPL